VLPGDADAACRIQNITKKGGTAHHQATRASNAEMALEVEQRQQPNKEMMEIKLLYSL